MMKTIGLKASALVLLLSCAAALAAQNAAPAVPDAPAPAPLGAPDRALAAYGGASFETVFGIIAESVPEPGADLRALRLRAAQVLSVLGAKEYAARNYLNAYECFRKALKYDPANAVAVAAFLGMRRDMDATKLANEGAGYYAVLPAAMDRPRPPEAAATEPAVAGTPDAPAEEAAAPAVPDATTQAAPSADAALAVRIPAAGAGAVKN